MTRADGERQACDGPELARKAGDYIRASWPAWPRLGDDDATRLTRYVVSEEVLQSAWNAAGALPLDALVPRRKSNPGTSMTDAVRYAVQSSGGCSDLDTLAHAASLADRVADCVTLSQGEAASPAASPAPTEPNAWFLAAQERSIGLPLHQMDPDQELYSRLILGPQYIGWGI